jgi:hypothetical protein
MSKYREGVGTSKIRMSRGQNVKSIFWTIRTSKVKRSERWKSLCQKERQKSEKLDFRRSDLFWRHR